MRLSYGITRTVFLTKTLAIKIPTFRTWALFLRGLLANMQEAEWSKTKDERLWACPGGWMIVMPRINVLTQEYMVNYVHFDGLPFETKPMNCGFYKGRLVLLDYGS